MKHLFMTFNRERDLIRYSEKSDLKDAVMVTENEAINCMMHRSYTKDSAMRMIDSVKSNPFNDWILW